MAILFHIEGIPETKAFLGGAAHAMRNPRAKLAFLGEAMILRNTRRMNAGLDVNNKPFEPSRRVSERGGKTLEDSGELLASMNYAASDNALDFFSTSKKARVHQEGLEIRPTAGHQFLTIPLRATGGMFASGGVDIKANRLGARAGDFSKKSTFFRRVGGRLFMFQKTGAHSIRALFLLVRSIQEKKREWFGFSPDDLDYAEQVLGSSIAGEDNK